MKSNLCKIVFKCTAQDDTECIYFDSFSNPSRCKYSIGMLCSNSEAVKDILKSQGEIKC